MSIRVRLFLLLFAGFCLLPSYAAASILCADGKTKCDYGCYQQNNQSYCYCFGGKKAGEALCAGVDSSAVCQLSTESSGKVNSTPCAAGESCVDGSCKKPSCMYNGKQMAEGQTMCGGAMLVSCKGAKIVRATCQYGCYVSNGAAYCKCQGGQTAYQTFCNGNKRYICQPSTSVKGSIQAAPCGANEFCAGTGVCQSCICQPGDARCSGDGKLVERCNGCTEWKKYQTCGSNQYCDTGACKNCLCKPDSLRCNGNAIEKCGQSCQSYTAIGNCPNGCSQGVCLPEKPPAEPTKEVGGEFEDDIPVERASERRVTQEKLPDTKVVGESTPEAKAQEKIQVLETQQGGDGGQSGTQDANNPSTGGCGCQGPMAPYPVLSFVLLAMAFRRKRR